MLETSIEHKERIQLRFSGNQCTGLSTPIECREMGTIRQQAHSGGLAVGVGIAVVRRKQVWLHGAVGYFCLCNQLTFDRPTMADNVFMTKSGELGTWAVCIEIYKFVHGRLCTNSQISIHTAGRVLITSLVIYSYACGLTEVTTDFTQHSIPVRGDQPRPLITVSSTVCIWASFTQNSSVQRIHWTRLTYWELNQN